MALKVNRAHRERGGYFSVEVKLLRCGLTLLDCGIGEVRLQSCPPVRAAAPNTYRGVGRQNVTTSTTGHLSATPHKLLRARFRLECSGPTHGRESRRRQ